MYLLILYGNKEISLEKHPDVEMLQNEGNHNASRIEMTFTQIMIK